MSVMMRRRDFLAGAATAGLVSTFPSRSSATGLENDRHLPRSAPEAQGVSSEGILEFLTAWEHAHDSLQSEPHSFMLVRHGHVIAETWWTPYEPRATHSLNSLTKIWTSTAVGLAI